MLPIYAEVFRIATFQNDRSSDARRRREDERERRDFERLTADLDVHLRRDIGLE